MVDQLDAGACRSCLRFLRSLDRRCRSCAGNQRRHMGRRCASSAAPGREFAGLRAPVRSRNRYFDLSRRLSLMVLFIIFCPIVAAILIMAGVPARKTALGASALTFAATLFLLVSFDRGRHDFQHVTSFAVSPQWHLSFTTGV